jgi:hypothetical protein
VNQTARLTAFSSTRVNSGITGHEGHEDTPVFFASSWPMTLLMIQMPVKAFAISKAVHPEVQSVKSIFFFVFFVFFASSCSSWPMTLLMIQMPMKAFAMLKAVAQNLVIGVPALHNGHSAAR